MNCLLHLLIIKRMATGKDNAAKNIRILFGSS